MTEGNVLKLEDKLRFGVKHFIVKKPSLQGISEGIV